MHDYFVHSTQALAMFKHMYSSSSILAMKLIEPVFFTVKTHKTQFFQITHTVFKHYKYVNIFERVALLTSHCSEKSKFLQPKLVFNLQISSLHSSR